MPSSTSTNQRRGLINRRIKTTSGSPAERHADLVVGYSHDPASKHALMAGADLARRLTAHLHVVHVIDLTDYPIDPDCDDWEQQATIAVQAEREEVRAALEGHLSGWTYHAARGNPADLLAEIATEHQALMVIVGSRGQGLGHAIERLMTGSVAHGLIHHCGRPVLIVPAPTRR